MLQFLIQIVNYSSAPPTELFHACAESNIAAWEEFQSRYHNLISVTVMRVSRTFGQTSSAIHEELIQDVYLKLSTRNCRALLQFDQQHERADFGYIRKLTCNLVLDHFAKKSTQQTEDIAHVSEIAVSDPQGTKAIERNALLEQIDSLVQEFTPPSTRKRDRRIFWLYYRDGWTTKELANLPWNPPLEIGGIESVIHRLSKSVRERISASQPGYKGKLSMEAL